MRPFKLLELLIAVAIISVLFALSAGALASARRSAWKRDCTNHLRCLGTYLAVYVDRYGGAQVYPPAPGHGFFETLYLDPTTSAAVARGNEGLGSCTVLRVGRHPPVYDYREPGPWMPGGRVVDGMTQPQWPIACDRPTNHDPSGQDDINILFFSGSVQSATFGSPEWKVAIGYTQ